LDSSASGQFHVSAKGGARPRTRFRPTAQAVAEELRAVNIELRRRLALCRSLREEGYDDPAYADMVGELREEIAMPIVEQAIAGELIDFTGAAPLYCMEAYRRVRRVSTARSRWERLLHHEVLLLLSSVSVQRALNFLIENENCVRPDSGGTPRPLDPAPHESD
jgi:hypothetical protein